MSQPTTLYSDFRLVRSSNVDEFEAAVDAYLKDGYVPVGGVATMPGIGGGWCLGMAKPTPVPSTFGNLSHFLVQLTPTPPADKQKTPGDTSGGYFGND